ncbi:hypothetical protein K040078D81_54290 [Blautia hominis]|uniref:Uncharacterized protein n=1 Tax=Blautia hominis TaxID=2025493 RepID=A0ABQ0BIM8_9FIRM
MYYDTAAVRTLNGYRTAEHDRDLNQGRFAYMHGCPGLYIEKNTYPEKGGFSCGIRLGGEDHTALCYHHQFQPDGF